MFGFGRAKRIKASATTTATPPGVTRPEQPPSLSQKFSVPITPRDMPPSDPGAFARWLDRKRWKFGVFEWFVRTEDALGRHGGHDVA